MVGYPDDENRVFSEWYALFTKKNHIISEKSNKYWTQNIKITDLIQYQNKNWQYISLKKFFKNKFISSENDLSLDISQAMQLGYPLDSHKLVFINGQLALNFSNQNIEPWTLTVNKNFCLCDIPNPIQSDIFLHLLECLSNEMISIRLPKKKITNKPLYLLYIYSGSNIPNTLITSHSFHNIIIERAARAHIIEHFININNYGNFSGSRILMTIKDEATLHHVKLICQNDKSYHMAYHDINIGKSAHISSNIFTIPSPKLTYHQTNIRLNHSQSSVSLNSLLLLSHQNTGSINTYLEHNNMGSALSRQKHKIIANNNSIGIFNGLIKVNKNAINTDGTMTNNNLLLHPSAKIYTTPKLEIYSDNVQCSHGSTTGQVNPDQLFYLESRGIPKQEAFTILLYAFSIEIINKIEHNILRNIILTNIEHTLIRSMILS